ncbi:MAG: apolipoprotein A1/A4/E family protein [Phycisphaerales bacterium]|nr:apolipoprotein A1/A4/E family protein [Phycisphaerales bacterium]
MGTTNSTTSNGTRTPIPVAVQSHINPTQQSSIVEPRSGFGAGIAAGASPGIGENEEMFLSPRVLDAGAFARFSEMLKSIISQANSQGRTLEGFSADAEAMVKRCDVTGEAINKRMQAGLRMIKMIDERAARTDLLLDKVSAAQPDSQVITAQLDAIIEQRLEKAQQQIEDVVARAHTRIEEANTRVLKAEEKTRRAVESSEGHALKLAELSSRVQGRLNELDARIENTRNETSKTLVEILDRTDSVTKGLNNAIDQVLARTHEAGEHLAIKVDEASELTDARIVELNASIEPVVEASQQAMRTLGIDPENPVFEDSPLARIEQLVERGETQLASLDRVYRQQEDLQSQAEGVKAVFGIWLVDAANDLDVLEERKDRIVGPMSEAADKINKLGPELEDNLELASTKLTHLQIEQQALRQTIQASSSVANEVSQRMTNESGQLQALLDGSLHKLSTRVEQAGVWLGALIQRAESLGATLPGAGVMNFGTEPIAAPTVSTPVPATTSTLAQSVAAISEPVSKAVIEPTIEDVIKEVIEEGIDEVIVKASMDAPRIRTPLPPSLPIDAFSFEGASLVIEHQIEDRKK